MATVTRRECEYIRKDIFHVGKIYLVSFEVDIAPDRVVSDLHGIDYTY